MRPAFLHIIIIYLLLFNNLYAKDTIKLDDENDVWEINRNFLSYLEDPTGQLTFQEVIGDKYQEKFRPAERSRIQNRHISSTYWIKVIITNNSSTGKNWIVEWFDFRIDYIEAYIPNAQGEYAIQKTGAFLPFYQKNYIHKNFLFDFPDITGEPQVLYFKIKAERPVTFIGVVRSYQEFTAYSTTEYFSLAIFYGIVVSMAFYNLFLFMALRDKTYLYYVLYVISIGIYGLSQDGLGFQFLWFNYPVLNDYVFPVSNYFMIVWAFFYARAFLNTQTYIPIVDKGILLLLAIRTLIFLGWLYEPSLAYIKGLDLFFLLYLFVAGVISWRNGYQIARFYVLAFTLFFSGFLLNVIAGLGYIKDSPFTAYSFNVGVLLEMIFLALALADRIKALTAEKEKAQLETIQQFKENEALKDKQNKELEEKVTERTKELDTFVYKSSHDIKGPIKSIIGLTNVAIKSTKDEESKVYFGHILITSTKLDKVVDQLLKVMEARNSKESYVRIDFNQMLSNILLHLQGQSGFNRLRIKTSVYQPAEFYSDQTLLFSTLQNLIENSIQYQDETKDHSFVHIDVDVKAEWVLIKISDNGLGIPKEFQEKIFEMFYKVSDSSSGTGLGLYMVKISLEKLGGTIHVESEPGVGSTFFIKLKKQFQPQRTSTSTEIPTSPDGLLLTG